MSKKKKIRIDVGCAATAPNSALWILADPEIQIFAFEPDLRSVNILKEGKVTNQYLDKPRVIESKRIIYFKNKIIKRFNKKNFKLYSYGIDNVLLPKNKVFYHVAKKNYGCSSLIKPITKKLRIKTDFKKKVKVYPLSYFMKKNNLNIVEMLKTDTQGNDLNVLKSAGLYIKNIIFIQSEYWTSQDYEGEKDKKTSRNQIIEYMRSKNFYCYYYTDTDIFFVNLKYKDFIKKNNIIDNCLDFPYGLYHKSKWLSLFDGKLIAFCILRDFLKFILPSKMISFIKNIK